MQPPQPCLPCCVTRTTQIRSQATGKEARACARILAQTGGTQVRFCQPRPHHAYERVPPCQRRDCSRASAHQDQEPPHAGQRGCCSARGGCCAPRHKRPAMVHAAAAAMTMAEFLTHSPPLPHEGSGPGRRWRLLPAATLPSSEWRHAAGKSPLRDPCCCRSPSPRRASRDTRGTRPGPPPPAPPLPSAAPPPLPPPPRAHHQARWGRRPGLPRPASAAAGRWPACARGGAATARLCTSGPARSPRASCPLAASLAPLPCRRPTS